MSKFDNVYMVSLCMIFEIHIGLPWRTFQKSKILAFSDDAVRGLEDIIIVSNGLFVFIPHVYNNMNPAVIKCICFARLPTEFLYLECGRAGRLHQPQKNNIKSK